VIYKARDIETIKPNLHQELYVCGGGGDPLPRSRNFEREKIVCVEQSYDLFISFLELGYRKFRNTPVI
jgi:hypothetical protein